MVHGDAIQHVGSPPVAEFHEPTAAGVLSSADIVDNNVMDAVAFSRRSVSSAIGGNVGDLNASADVADWGVADPHLSDLAEGTVFIFFYDVVLVLRSQQNGEPHLRESTPAVFENVVFRQHPLRIF